MFPPASVLTLPCERIVGAFRTSWILFEERKLRPYLTDRSINDSPIPVKTIGSGRALTSAHRLGLLLEFVHRATQMRMWEKIHASILNKPSRPPRSWPAEV